MRRHPRARTHSMDRQHHRETRSSAHQAKNRPSLTAYREKCGLDGLRVLRRAIEIPRRRGEFDDLDLRDTAHDGLPQKPATLGSQRLRAGT